MSSTGIVKRKSSLVKSTNDKPPHSYIALIATAILKSPEKRLTLSEINDYLIKHYTFFQGPYKGWRNSVRHNLSYNKCFTKILKDPSRPWGKDNYWTISSLNDYLQEDGSFRRRRRRRPKGKDIVKQELEFTLASDEDESSTDGEKLTSGSSRESQNGSPEARRTSPALPSTTFNSSFSISTILGEKLEPKRQERNTQGKRPKTKHLFTSLLCFISYQITSRAPLVRYGSGRDGQCTNRARRFLKNLRKSCSNNIKKARKCDSSAAPGTVNSSLVQVMIYFAFANQR